MPESVLAALVMLAVLLMLGLSGWQMALILKLRMDMEKFGRLLRKLRNREKTRG